LLLAREFLDVTVWKLAKLDCAPELCLREQLDQVDGF
jgi:hypothetical protein